MEEKHKKKGMPDANMVICLMGEKGVEDISVVLEREKTAWANTNDTTEMKTFVYV